MLKGIVKPISAYTEEEIQAMYRIMAQFYDDTEEAVFRRDFFDKDYCLALYHETEGIVGFTTQKVLALDVDGKTVHGMFSGDTIIGKDHWGDLELFRTWAKFWFPFAEQYEEFYWFLICKGYKTYRIIEGNNREQKSCKRSVCLVLAHNHKCCSRCCCSGYSTKSYRLRK